MVSTSQAELTIKGDNWKVLCQPFSDYRMKFLSAEEHAVSALGPPTLLRWPLWYLQGHIQPTEQPVSHGQEAAPLLDPSPTTPHLQDKAALGERGLHEALKPIPSAFYFSFIPTSKLTSK